MSLISGGQLLKYGAPLLKEVISSIIPGKTGEKLANAIMPEFIRRAADLDTAIAGHQSDVIRSETDGDSWFGRNWRPITMLVMVSIVALNYLVAPICNTFIFPTIQFFLNLVLSDANQVGQMKFVLVPVDQNVWDLIKIGVPGYIGARTTEKAFKIWRDTRQHQANKGVTPPAQIQMPPNATTTQQVPAKYSSMVDLPIKGVD